MKKTALLCMAVIAALLTSTACGANTGAADPSDAVPDKETASSEAMTAENEAAPPDEAAAGSSAYAAGAEGEVLNIYCLGSDFMNRVQDYVPGYEKVSDERGLIGETQVRWHVYDSRQDYLYDLDEMLQRQAPEESEAPEDAEAPEETEVPDEEMSDEDEDADAADEDTDPDSAAGEPDPDERVDLFIAEESFLPKYVNSVYSLDVMSDVGLTEEALSDQFPYTRLAATDGQGAQKAVAWHVMPGVFVYRRSIAEQVLGFSDPERVQEAVSDWERFEQTADLMKEEGYYMLSGYDDAFMVYADNTRGPWVENDEFSVDEHLIDWADQARSFVENGYTHGTEMWSEDWYVDHSADGEVFGFFDSNWGVHFTLTDKAMGNTPESDEEEEDYDDEGEEESSGDAVGDYGACMGPEAFHHSGTWIVAAAGGDNPETVRLIMESLTCDPENMCRITEDIQEFTNTVSGMEKLCENRHESEVLGGQDPLPVFLNAAKALNSPHLTTYDGDLGLGFEVSMRDYIRGEITQEAALDNFYGAVAIRYPELSVRSEEEEEE